MKTRNLLALAALAVALVAVDPSALAQLPPSPSDAPPAERPGVRPTPAPRTPPPPPPGGDPRAARRPAPDPVAPPGPAVPPPPPPESTIPTPPSPPVLKVDKVFGTRGVFELGGSFDFSVQLDRVNNSNWLNMGLDAYAGYFVTKYFALGLYLSVYFSQNQTEGQKSWTVTPGLLAAPGIAVRLMPRVFFYTDLLAGVYGRKSVLNDLTASRGSDVYGAVGGEVGIKLRIAGRFLMRLGLRPIYYVGSSETTTGSGSYDSDIGWFTFMIRIGFSGFL